MIAVLNSTTLLCPRPLIELNSHSLASDYFALSVYSSALGKKIKTVAHLSILISIPPKIIVLSPRVGIEFRSLTITLELDLGLDPNDHTLFLGLSESEQGEK